MFLRDEVRLKVHESFKAMGFDYVALDILGYRTGSMNETLSEDDRMKGANGT